MLRIAPTGSRLAAAATLAVLLGGPQSAAQQIPSARLLGEPCPPRASAAVTSHALAACFYEAAMRASRAALHVVSFETGRDARPETATAYLDAAAVASAALVEIAGEPGGQAALARIARVVITEGAAPAARRSDGALMVTVFPAAGVAGVPSARQIERAARAP